MPEQAPLQPAKLEPVAGVAASVTFVPLASPALHTPGQFSPPPVTVPAPLPASATDRVWSTGIGWPLSATPYSVWTSGAVSSLVKRAASLMLPENAPAGWLGQPLALPPTSQ